MIWTAWNNGKHHPSGAGYGLKVDPKDRDQHFSGNWDCVLIDLPRGTTLVTVRANIVKNSFWGPQCTELISQPVGRWLLDDGNAPWPAGAPPKFEIQNAGNRRFVVQKKVMA